MAPEKTPTKRQSPNSARDTNATRGGTAASEQDSQAWQGELENRLEAYRVRRQHTGGVAAQSRLPFDEPSLEAASRNRAAVAEAAPPAADEEFSFTIAIGRYAPPSEKRDSRMMIDVSIPPGAEEGAEDEEPAQARHYGLYPVASLQERGFAAVIDVICLLFAYGGFLALFGSLGGEFELSKLSAAVYVATFIIVYLQYFALFTVFGGTTPGMMFRGLQVASFTGEAPSSRQMLLRCAGYMISAGALFMGFVWSLWDEDTLAWHDRISRTYLSSPETRAEFHAPGAAHSR